MSDKLKHTISSAFVAIAFLAVSAYIIFQFVRSNINNYKIDISVPVSYKETVKTDAVIFMNEELIKKNSKNGIERYLIGDGNRVARDSAICSIYPVQSSASDFNKAKKIKNQLEIYKKSNISSSQIDFTLLDENIKAAYLSMLQSISDNDFKSANQYSNETIISLNKRLISVGKISSYDQMITNLTLSLNQIENSYLTSTENICAEQSGYFFKNVDGYEKIFDPRMLDNITIEGYDELISSSPQTYENDVIGKLCTEYEWYFACKVSSDIAASMILDKNYDIDFPLSDNTANVSLYRKIEQPKSDISVLIFKSIIFPENFNYKRIQKISFNFDSGIEGVRVPNDAIRVINGETGVYVIVGNKIEFRAVDIIYSSGIYYVSALNDEESENKHKFLGKNEKVIISGKDVYEGKIID